MKAIESGNVIVGTQMAREEPNMHRRFTGPGIYANWRASIAGEPVRETIEYSFYTDAHIIAEVRDDLGPYQLLNAVPIPIDSLSLSIVLRAVNHLDYQQFIISEERGTKVESYHGGGLADEVAALVSLCLGIRVKVGGVIRHFRPDGDPKGEPIGPRFYREPSLNRSGQGLILPRTQSKHSLVAAERLTGLFLIDDQEATALVLAPRQYQEAMWIAEAEPHMSWLLFVSAVETAANQWRPTQETPLERLQSSRPELLKILREKGDEQFVNRVAEQIAPYMGATRKFIDFILEFEPGPPEVRPDKDWARFPWRPSTVKQAMRTVYKWRSRALHGGTPFPLPMCDPPRMMEEKPFGHATYVPGAVWEAKDTPMLLHVFEHIVRGSLLNWWASLMN